MEIRVLRGVNEDLKYNPNRLKTCNLLFLFYYNKFEKKSTVQLHTCFEFLNHIKSVSTVNRHTFDGWVRML